MRRVCSTQAQWTIPLRLLFLLTGSWNNKWILTPAGIIPLAELFIHRFHLNYRKNCDTGTITEIALKWNIFTVIWEGMAKRLDPEQTTPKEADWLGLHTLLTYLRSSGLGKRLKKL